MKMPTSRCNCHHCVARSLERALTRLERPDRLPIAVEVVKACIRDLRRAPLTEAHAAEIADNLRAARAEVEREYRK